MIRTEFHFMSIIHCRGGKYSALHTATVGVFGRKIFRPYSQREGAFNESDEDPTKIVNKPSNSLNHSINRFHREEKRFSSRGKKIFFLLITNYLRDEKR